MPDVKKKRRNKPAAAAAGVGPVLALTLAVVIVIVAAAAAWYYTLPVEADAAIWLLDEDQRTAYAPAVELTDNGNGEMVLRVWGDRRNTAAPAPYPWGLTYMATCGGLPGTLITHVPQWTYGYISHVNTASGSASQADTLPITNRTLGGGWHIPGGVDVPTGTYALDGLATTFESAATQRPLPYRSGTTVIPMPDTAASQADMWRDHRVIVKVYTTTAYTDGQAIEIWGNPSDDHDDSVYISSYIATKGSGGANLAGLAARNDAVWMSTQVHGDVGTSDAGGLGRADFVALAAGYPAALQPGFTTLMLMGHGALHGAGETLTVHADRGDMMIITTTDNSTIDTAGWQVAGTVDMRNRVIELPASAGAAGGPEARTAWDMHTWMAGAATAGPATLVTHDSAADYTLWWHVRPLYDLGTTSTHDSQSMVIPKYLLSNQGTITCSVWAYEAELFERQDSLTRWVLGSQLQAGARLSTFIGAASANVTRECDPADNHAMPATRWTSLLRPSFFDITPDTYCSVPASELEPGAVPPAGPGAAAPPSPYAPLNHTVSVAIPEEVSGPLYGHVAYSYAKNSVNEDMKTVRLRIIPIDDQGARRAFTDQAGNRIQSYTATDGTSGITCSARPVSGNDEPWTPAIINARTMIIGTVSVYESIQLRCENLAVSWADGAGNHTVLETFDKTIPAYRPYFRTIVMDLESDVWGWGTGTDADGFQSNFMGVGFLMTMVILSATAGFRKAHVPASLIIFYSVIAAATYFKVVDVPTGILSGILVLVIVGIFSVGLKR